jgi:hypothetical protein
MNSLEGVYDSTSAIAPGGYELLLGPPIALTSRSRRNGISLAEEQPLRQRLRVLMTMKTLLERERVLRTLGPRHRLSARGCARQ